MGKRKNSGERDKPISLYPLTPEEALRIALNTKPPPRKKAAKKAGGKKKGAFGRGE